MNSRVHLKSNYHDWETPQELFDLLDSIFHFTLDPCATAQNSKCNKFFTIFDDGLSKSWSGERVFVNPPFGHQLHKWVKKSYYESRNALVVMLIPARTDTSYWHDYIFGKALIYFIKGRIYFSLHNEVSQWRATFPAAIVVYSSHFQTGVLAGTLKDMTAQFGLNVVAGKCTYRKHLTLASLTILAITENLPQPLSLKLRFAVSRRKRRTQIPGIRTIGVRMGGERSRACLPALADSRGVGSDRPRPLARPHGLHARPHLAGATSQR